MGKKKIKWQLIVKARTALLFEWYVFEGNKAKIFKSSLGIRFGQVNEKIVSDEISIDLNEWIKLEKILTSKVKKEPRFLKHFIALCYRYSGRLIKTAKQVGKTKKLERVENQKLLYLYKKYQDSVLSLIPFLNSTLVLDNVLKKNIVNLLKNKLKIKRTKEQDLLLSRLVIPKKKSFFIKEGDALLKMALKLQKNKKADIEQDIQGHLEKYAWTSCHAYLGVFQTEKDVMNKVEELLKEGPKTRIARGRWIRQETSKYYKQAFDEIKDSKKIVDLIDLAREFIYLQTYRLDVLFSVHYYVYPLFQEIGKRFNLSVRELVYLTGEEIVALLENKHTVGKKEIKNRMRNYALIKENNQYRLLSGDSVEKIIQKVIRVSIVRGTVANEGRAIGRAKLVYEVEDMEKVNMGDIVVSVMTLPRLIFALSKASGIITDLGGMLCHAALVSRELGIPCIVGTKNATKVFKDGDLIELNAYEGVARKLEK